MSSTWQGSRSKQLAVNGDTGGYLSNNNCIHTDAGDRNTYWEVDLGQPYTVNRLVSYGRNECVCVCVRCVCVCVCVCACLAVLCDAASQVQTSSEPPGEEIFPLELTWVLTQFPKTLSDESKN